ncbi:hypothetical protein B0J17DRAFT_52079 [Rhizoctonia solani]|nr:hypothetical protein B0J17DRAFT_52079 [Rhizoctonia solani]
MRTIFLGVLACVSSLLIPSTLALNSPPSMRAVAELRSVSNDHEMASRNIESMIEPERFDLESSGPSEFLGVGRLAARQSCPGGYGTCSNDPATCCPLGGGCCGGGRCCGSGNWCYAGGCCPNNRNGCDNKGCCPKDYSCCQGGSCCQPGYYCVRTSSGKIGCCPNGKICSTSSNAQKGATDASVPPTSANGGDIV